MLILPDRRSFLINGSLVMLATGVKSKLPLSDGKEPECRFGLVTDLHYADKPTAGSRFYRESIAKLEEAAEKLKTEKPAFVVELGDFIDAASDVEKELEYLNSINRIFGELPGEKHYVLGNHCVHTLTKTEFLEAVEKKNAYYSFDQGQFHFVVLDACFREDGEPYGRQNFDWKDPNLSAEELEWLKSDLESNSDKSVIVLVHQRLDQKSHYSVKNAEAVRNMFLQHGNVLAVFQGHSHENDYQEIDGVHYCTVAAMVEGSGEENNSYATVDLFEDGSIHVNGFRKQVDRTWDVG